MKGCGRIVNVIVEKNPKGTHTHIFQKRGREFTIFDILPQKLLFKLPSSLTLGSKIEHLGLFCQGITKFRVLGGHA